MATMEKQKLVELKKFIELAKKQPHSESHLIAVMHKAQELYGYLSKEIMDEVSKEMNIPTAHIWGVATFYHYFNLIKPGKHVISICLGTACYVKGAAAILETLKKELGINLGETTEDKMFSIQPARCLGACGLAPVVMIDDKIHGELTPQKMAVLIDQYRNKE